MLAYDQQIRRGGLSLRVLTEHRDAGAESLIVSSLLLGQKILSTRKVRVPREIVAASGLQLAGLMGRQHRRVLAELDRGRLDRVIATTSGADPSAWSDAERDDAHQSGARGVAEHRSEEALPSARREAGAEHAPSLDRIVQELLGMEAVDRPMASLDQPEPAEELEPGATLTHEGFVARTAEVPPASEFDDARTTAVGPLNVELEDHAALHPHTAFTGDLATLTIPDLLEFLALSRRSGALVVVGRNGIAEVHLRHGMLGGAVATCCRSIGALLLEATAVDESSLARAQRAQEGDQTDWSLGAILARQGVVTRDALERALERQVREVLRQLVGWKAGRFTFDPQGSRTWHRRSDIEIELDTREVLLDVIRELDEEAHLQV